MQAFRRVKLALAISLLCALFLPLGQCSRQSGTSTIPSHPKRFSQRVFPQSDDQTEYHYGIADVSFSLRGLLTIVAFGWPLLFVLVGRRAEGKRLAWLLPIGELILCAGTSYWLWAMTVFYQWLYGAYVVFAIVIIYAAVALITLLGYLRIVFKQSSPTLQSS